MMKQAVPMIHVPDVRAAVEWYQGVGFTVTDTYDDGGDGLSFAILAFGSSSVMFNQGGRPSEQHRREVDLYVYTENVDELYRQLKDRVEMVEEPHDKFYGMREFIIRDLNGFWLTFGQPSAFARLMNGVREGNAELVRNALESGIPKPEALTAALAAASESDHPNAEIRALLENAGALLPAEVDEGVLQSYVGRYKGEHGIELSVTFEHGQLFAAAGSQTPLRLMAVDDVTFRPVTVENYGTLTFNVEAGKTTGCVLKHDGGTMQLTREAE